jgi:phosphate-selective porin
MRAKGWSHGLVTVGALLLGLAVTASSWAQGMYYKEILKDGRYYVFNKAKVAEDFEKSGELGVAITRPSAGPNGETVVADSEEALELFFFKHGVAATVEKPKKPKMEVKWSNGKTTLDFDKAQVNISNRVQVRFTQESPDGAVQLAGTEAAGDGKGSFRMRRAKFKVDGWFYTRFLTYEIQLNWPAATGSNIGAFLEDANIDWDVSKKQTFRIKFGQFKFAQGRQELTSSGSQQFVDRSAVENRYNAGRDTGIQLWGSVLSKKVEWRLGAYNGNGLTRTTNDNAKYLLAARLQLHPNGDPGYSETDFQSRGKALWAVAGSYQKNDLHFATSGNDQDLTTLGVDAVFKYNGVFATAEWYTREAKPETGATLDSPGWFGQAGYLIGGPQKGKWEVAFRYGEFDPSDLVSGNKQKEVGGAVSYYNNQHNLKVQADFRQIKDEAANSGNGTKNKEFRLQTQFIF